MLRTGILLGALFAALLVAGCGGGDDEDGGSSASADDVTACIEEQDLKVTTQGSAVDEELEVEDTLQVQLPAEGGRPNAIMLTFYENEDAASEGADNERTFIEGAGAGGTVEQEGSVVVAIARSGNEQELEQVKGCL